MKHGKKYTDSAKLIESLKQYDPEEAADLVLKTSKAKFDETVEISVRLGVDPRHADPPVRGFCGRRRDDRQDPAGKLVRV